MRHRWVRGCASALLVLALAAGGGCARSVDPCLDDRRLCDATLDGDAVAPCEGSACIRPDVVRDPCAPQDVRGEGSCDRSAGIYWNGRDCGFLWACRCVGRDCGLSYHTIDACREAHAHCR